MKRIFRVCLFFIPILLTSCYSLEQMPIEYMVPADVSFPEQIRRIGVVNNVNNNPDNEIILGDSTKRLLEVARKVTYHDGEPKTATQSLAEAIAEQNYFDVVVICDSALRAHDIHPRETTLSRTEINDLTSELNVDAIIALENIQIKIQRIITMIPGGNGFWGTVDAIIIPSVALYLPQRTGPLVRINAKDSIFWEKDSYSEVRLMSSMISDDQVIKEASEYAGNIPIKYLLPYWKTSTRFIYSTGSPDMRDAHIYVKENDWDKAAEIWKRVYETKSEKKKMHAAVNLSVYYELNDDFNEAISWINKAIELSENNLKYETIFIGDESGSVLNKNLYLYYQKQLTERKEADAKIKMQMNRFEEE
ncbi:MAG: DUF6340 family protein [Bacteroides sp.]|nr:DUF6340 family protein [Bacteroides sp.]